MDLQGRNNISFKLSGTDPLEEVYELTLNDIDSGEEIAVIKVEKSKSRAVTEALREIFRSSFGSFEDHQRATVKVDNRNEGTIRFE